MAIIEGLDSNNTWSNSGLMDIKSMTGLYYYYLDNNLLKENDKLSCILQLNTIQSLSYLPFFNESDFSVVKSKLDYAYYKANTSIKDLYVYRFQQNQLKKDIFTFTFESMIKEYINNHKSLSTLLYPYRYFLLGDGVNPPLMLKIQDFTNDNKMIFTVETFVTPNSKYKVYARNNSKKDVNGEIESLINNVSLLLPIGSSSYQNFLMTNGNSYQATNNLAHLENDITLKQNMQSLNLSNEQNNVSNGIGLLSSLLSMDFRGVTNSAVDLYYKNKNYNLNKNQLQENYNLKNYQIETQRLATTKDYLNTPRTMKTLGNDALFSFNNTNGKLRLYEFVCQNEDNINEYYKRYGYRLNKYKVPFFNQKSVYNFIKTSNCNIDTNGTVGMQIPIEHIRQLEQIFNSGVTFWKVENGNNIGQYGLYNEDV